MDRMATQDSHAFPVQTVKVSPELLSSKRIDKGIEATVAKCNCLRHVDRQLQIPLHVTLGKEVIEIERL